MVNTFKKDAPNKRNNVASRLFGMHAPDQELAV
jgi:hypothetical protein